MVIWKVVFRVIVEDSFRKLDKEKGLFKDIFFFLKLFYEILLVVKSTIGMVYSFVG